MRQWKVNVEKILETEFILTEEELEDESPEVAAEELSLDIPSYYWDEVDYIVDIKEIT